ncbi:intradiol ring-cleavage dioxygenase [Aquabacterium sp.]|uniref:dioxygenase family protein n=1 Tax=Aquabacterium sp. TaxID=1872578 RepID=UPI002CC00461|nr:intradiol ring-cleavage dioxygenase [Aquabacterium sp.]HSW08356.1 intradiol ring-cleavage dioxygenase [Aquabacterium sp.]
MSHHDHHDHDLGLAADLDTLVRQTTNRRRALRWLGAGGAASSLVLLGCGGGEDSSDTSSTSTGTTTTTGTTTGTTTTTTTPSSCATIPEETAGPYPGDGSNTANGSVANALALSGIVRSDIRSSIGSASGTATGIKLTVKLQVVNTGASCAALAGRAVYLWHCDSAGRYSMYSSGITDQNYLRGVQETDSSGNVSFTTIFPGCYDGRMPHMHFEVYPSLASATSYSSKIKTSQIAFPVSTCSEVYATTGYSASVSNLARISFSTDNVFSDGVTLQLATVTGNVTDGYVATLVVGVAG